MQEFGGIESAVRMQCRAAAAAAALRPKVQQGENGRGVVEEALRESVEVAGVRRGEGEFPGVPVKGGRSGQEEEPQLPGKNDVTLRRERRKIKTIDLLFLSCVTIIFQVLFILFCCNPCQNSIHDKTNTDQK